MTDDRHSRSSPRARPVADLPGDAVLARADDLARRWAIALIRARPLEDIAEIAFEQLAREAPSLCAQAVRALQSDVELDRLTGTGTASSRADSAPARRLALIAGAADPVAAVVAVEALRGVLWEALLDELHEPSPRQIGDIADRLACVCTAALAAAVEAAFAAVAGAAIDAAEGSSEAGDAPSSARYTRVAPPGRQAVIVDERAGVRPDRRGPATSPTSEQPRAQEHPLPWDVSSPQSTSGARAEEIEIRDVRDIRDVQVERGEQGPAAWIGSIGGQLQRFRRDERPFAVLLVELVDVERLHEEESPGELTALAARMEQALEAESGSSSGSLTRERPGRCWLLAGETDHDGARELAERLARAVASRTSSRGGPLEVAIGVAVCPEDGREAATLAAHADVGLYAARAAIRASAGERAARSGGA